LIIIDTKMAKNTMYHSGVSEKDPRTIGRSPDCDLALEDDTVSRMHATVTVTAEGYLAVEDEASSNGTWLHRNGRWIRARRVVLGTADRIRFGDREVALDKLVDLFGRRGLVRLREGYTARGRPLVMDGLENEAARPRVVLENPRRNPVTGDIEEYESR
jgi:pSer/pThr/pTyr-binding forkhead associated (FHA) protein